MKETREWLIDEYPLMFRPSLACLLGLNDAVFLQQVQDSISSAEPHGFEKTFHEGRWWICRSVPSFKAVSFQFWSEPEIRRIIARLTKKGILITGHLAQDPMDRSNWYAIDDDALYSLEQKDAEEVMNGNK